MTFVVIHHLDRHPLVGVRSRAMRTPEPPEALPKSYYLPDWVCSILREADEISRCESRILRTYGLDTGTVIIDYAKRLSITTAIAYRAALAQAEDDHRCSSIATTLELEL